MGLSRATKRRIQKEEKKLLKKREVINLCTDNFLLSKMPNAKGHVKNCYASALGNCVGPISKEHYISKNLLSQISSISAEGIPWLKGKMDLVKPDFLVANCLCKYHNEFSKLWKKQDPK